MVGMQGQGLQVGLQYCEWGLQDCKWGQRIASGVVGVADLGLAHCACHTRQPMAESTLSALDLFSHSRCAQCCFESAPTQLTMR